MADTNSILSMTEHGAFVWPSYVIVTVVLIGLVVVSLASLRKTTRDLAEAEKTTRAGRGDGP